MGWGSDPFADLIPRRSKATDRAQLGAMSREDPFGDLVPPTDPRAVSAALPTKELLALAESSGIPAPTTPVLPRSVVSAQPSDATRVTLGHEPEPSPTVGPARSSRIAFQQEPGTRLAAELARRAARRRAMVQGLESTLPGALIGGENQLAAAEGLVQTGTLPARLINRGVAGLLGRDSPLPATPAESAAELEQAGMLPESKRLPLSGITKHAGLETRRDVAGFVGSLPGLTPVFRAAGAVMKPVAGSLARTLAERTGSKPLTRVLSETAREAGTVGLAMGAQADAEALSQGRSPDEALTEGVVAGLQGAALGGAIGAVKPALRATQDALARFLIEQSKRPPKPRVGNIADLPKRPAVDAEGMPIREPAEPAAPRAVVRVEEPGPRAPESPSPKAPTSPATHQITFSDGRKVGIRYRVVDLTDLQPSHDAFSFQANPRYPEGVQGRDYAADKTAQEVVRTRAQQFDPDLALDPSLAPDKGPPIVTPDGVVVAGNERTMLLRRAAQLAPERYDAYVKALAGRMPEEARATTTARSLPVLVREIADPSLDTRDVETLRQLNRASDVSDAKTMRGLDDAASRATQMRQARSALTHFTQTISPDESLADYLGGANGRTFVRQLVEDGVLSPQELARHVEPKSGLLTEEGRLLIRRTMLAATVDDPGVFARVPPSIVAKLEPAVPHLIGTRASPEWDISAQVQGALEVLAEAKEKGLGVEELLAQVSAFEAQVPDAVANMARFLAREPKKVIVERFRRYQALAQEAEVRSSTEDMFEDLVPSPQNSRLVFADLIPSGRQTDLFKPPEAIQSSLFGGQPERSAPVAGETMRQARRVLEDPREQMLAKQGTPSQAYKEALAFTRQTETIRADEAAVRPEAVRGEAEEPAGERPIGLFGAPGQRPVDPVLGLRGGFGGGSPLAASLDPVPGTKSTNVPAVIQALVKVTEAAGKAVPFREGRIKQKRFAGVYKVQPEVIRSQQANDVSTASHEVAHALEKLLFGAASRQVQKQPGVDPTMRRELRALGKALYGNSRPAAGYLSEGWAEYLRTWLTESDPNGRSISPSTVAPSFTRWFEADFATRFPEVRAALVQARDLSRRWQQQGSLERARQSIVDPASPGARLQRAASDVRGWFTVAKWIDMADPLNHLARMAETSLGRPLTPIEDPYLTTAALRMTHAARVRYMVEGGMIDLAGNKVGPALQEIRPLVQGRYEDFTIYLWARRAAALYRDPRGARNPGLSQEDTARILAELGTPKFELAASKVYAWNNGVLDYAAQASPTFARVVEQVRQVDPGDYVPLQREFDALDSRWATAGVSRSSPVQHLKGSGRRIADIFPAMIAKAEATVRAAHQRLVLDQVVALSEKAEGLGALVEEVSPDQVPVLSQTIQQLMDRINATLGPEAGVSLTGIEGLDFNALAGETLTFFAPATAPKGGDPIIPVIDRGRLRWFQVSAELYRTLGTLDIYRLPLALDWLFGKPARMLRAGTTGLRASFGLLWNPIRDLQTLYANTQSTRNPAALMGSYLAALADVARQRTGFGKGGAYLDTFLRLGGEMAQPLGQDIPHTRRAARRLAEGAVVRTLDPRNWFDWYRDVVQIPESVPRVAELKEVAKEIGWEPGQPMTLSQSLQLLLAAKQVTTDFSAAGEFARTMNQIAPFHNAAIQGPRANYRAFRRNPSQFAFRVAQLAALSLLLWYQHKDEEWYQALTFKERFQNWHIPVTLGGQQEVVRIPRAFEVGALAAIPEVIAAAWVAQDPEAATAWMKELFALATPNVTPVLLDEAFDQYANEDRYSGRPIVPRGEEDLDPGEQAGEYTSKAAIGVARAVGVSPRRLDHALRGIAGPLATDVVEAVGMGSGKQPQERRAADLPVAGRLFVRQGMQAKAVNDFYERYEAAERHRQTWRELRESGDPRADGYLRSHEDDIALVVTAEEAGVAGPLREAYRELTKLQQQNQQATTIGSKYAIHAEMRRIATEALRQVRADRAEARP